MHTPENEALRRDADDPGHRHLFHIPPADGGRYPDTAYLAGGGDGAPPTGPQRRFGDGDARRWAARVDAFGPADLVERGADAGEAGA